MIACEPESSWFHETILLTKLIYSYSVFNHFFLPNVEETLNGLNDEKMIPIGKEIIFSSN